MVESFTARAAASELVLDSESQCATAMPLSWLALTLLPKYHRSSGSQWCLLTLSHKSWVPDMPCAAFADHLLIQKGTADRQKEIKIPTGHVFASCAEDMGFILTDCDRLWAPNLQNSGYGHRWWWSPIILPLWSSIPPCEKHKTWSQFWNTCHSHNLAAAQSVSYWPNPCQMA